MNKSDELLNRVNGEILDEKKLNSVKGGSCDWSKFWNIATCVVGDAGRRAGAATGSGATCHQ